MIYKLILVSSLTYSEAFHALEAKLNEVIEELNKLESKDA